MRIALTGISGFVGAAVAAHLTKAGHQVVGISRRGSLVADLAAPDFAARVAEQTAPCEAVVHCAASLENDALSQPMLLTNALGTQNALHLAAGWNTRVFIYLSSVGVIGTPRLLPIDEDHPTSPGTGYHAAKLFGEHLVTLAATASRRTLSLRLAAPIGVQMPRNRILPVFLSHALHHEPIPVTGQGTRTQNYVDVRDVARAVELGLQAEASGVCNLGGPRTISNLDLAQLCIGLTKSRSDIRFSGTDTEEGRRWDLSLARAQATLGYKPAHTLEDSILSLASAL